MVPAASARPRHIGPPYATSTTRRMRKGPNDFSLVSGDSRSRLPRVRDVLERVPSRPRRHQGRRRQARDGILVAPPQCPSARSQRVPDEPRHHQLVGTAQHGSHTRSRPERGPPPLVVVVVHLCRAHRKLRDAAAFAMPRLQGRALAP
jgi:hypothetical protein